MAAPRGGHSCIERQRILHVCYVDESGDAESLRSHNPNSTPVFVLVGMTVPDVKINSLTWEFLQLKKQFNPSLNSVQLSELIQFEMKGSSLRRDLRRAGRNNSRRAKRILDGVFELLENHNCQLVGKVIVKEVDVESRGDKRIYSRAIANLAESFEAQLSAADTNGIMVLDARTKVKNAPNTLGITTRRFRAGGGGFHKLVESPVFGHSDTHVPLQIVDLIASAVVFPIACIEYCSALRWNSHPHANHREIKERYGLRLQALEYRYLHAEGAMRGGFQVVDPVSAKPTHLMFRNS